MFSKHTSTMTRRPKIAVIGLGVMGRPIAANLAGAGFDVIGHTRTPAKLGRERPSLATGVRGTIEGPREAIEEALPFALAPTAEEAIEAADVVLLAVPGLDDVHEVLGNATVAGKAIVLLATVDPDGSYALGERLTTAGAEYVEAPVAGSVAQAEDASLLVLVSAAERRTVDRLEPVFKAFASKTTWCGPPPNAMTIKLANNLVQIGLFQALAEATRMVEHAGLDLALFYDVLNSGAMANRVLEAKTAKLLLDDLTPQAPLRHVRKDTALIRAQAARLGLDLPGVEATGRTFDRALAAGLGELDAMAILRVLRS